MAANEIAEIAHGSGGRVGDKLALSPPTFPRSSALSGFVRLERLVPLVDYFAAWKLLPNVFRWVLQTVERGAVLPPFNEVIPMMVGPKQALVIEQELNTLLRKEPRGSPREESSSAYKVTRRCLRVLRLVEETLVLVSGPLLGAPCRLVTLAMDASLTGWGAVMSGHPARGLWRGRNLKWHINCLEMLAVFQALKYFIPDMRDHMCWCKPRANSSS